MPYEDRNDLIINIRDVLKAEAKRLSEFGHDESAAYQELSIALFASFGQGESREEIRASFSSIADKLSHGSDNKFLSLVQSIADKEEITRNQAVSVVTTTREFERKFALWTLPVFISLFLAAPVAGFGIFYMLFEKAEPNFLLAIIALTFVFAPCAFVIYALEATLEATRKRKFRNLIEKMSL
jgi:hypothetical protein